MRSKTYIGDFETSTGNIDNSTNIYLWGLRDLDKKESIAGVSMDEFIDSVKHYKVRKILFHNLAFDGQFITHWLVKGGYAFDEESFNDPIIPNTFCWMKDYKNTIYELRINIDGHVVRVGDTAKLFVASVDSLGKDLGLPKLEIDYHKYKFFEKLEDVPPLLIEYLWRDIDIVIDVYNQFKQSYKSPGITLGGTALKSFKKHYGKGLYVKHFGGYYYDFKTKEQVYNPVLTVEQWDEFKKGYRGGLTIFDHSLIGQDIKDIAGFSADYNSLYPSVMRDYTYPIGKPYDYPLYKDMLEHHKILIIKATLKEGHKIPFIPANDEGSSKIENHLHVVENDYYNVWSWELEMWKEGYDIEYRIVKTWYFEPAYVFKTWVNELKSLKENATHPIDRRYHKGILNNLYGKFGQNRKRKHKNIVYDPDNKLGGTRYGHNQEYGEEIITKYVEDLSYIPIASAITSRARCELLKAVFANKDKVMYCDTDSIYTIGEPVGLAMDDNAFSHWKYEKQFNRFKFLKAKAYLAQLTHEYKSNKGWKETDEIHRAIAGLSTENHDLVNFDNFNSGQVFPGGRIQKKNVEGGVILVEVNYTL